MIIIDLGLARQCAGGERCFTICGTLGYQAPEIVELQVDWLRITPRGYERAVDAWSSGIVLYAILIGNMAFGYDTRTTYAVRNDDPPFDEAQWEGISSATEFLTCALLRRYPGERLRIANTLEQARFKDELPGDWFGRGHDVPDEARHYGNVGEKTCMDKAC